MKQQENYLLKKDKKKEVSSYLLEQGKQLLPCFLSAVKKTVHFTFHDLAA